MRTQEQRSAVGGVSVASNTRGPGEHCMVRRVIGQGYACKTLRIFDCFLQPSH